MVDCTNLQRRLAELKQLELQFERVLDSGAKTGKFEAAHELRIVIDTKVAELRELLMPRELRDALAESQAFFTRHSLADFAHALSEKLPPLSESARARLREAKEQGFDRMMILPAELLYPTGKNETEKASKRAKIVKDQLLPLAKYKNDPYEGSADAMHASTPRNRPESGVYILCYSSNPIPQETKGKTYSQLDELFTEKKWNGLTYQEYLILQRLECEKRKEVDAEHHMFDGWNSDEKKSNSTWLLDSSAPAGRLDAYWDPEDAKVRAFVGGSTDSGPNLGARPAVIVRF